MDRLKVLITNCWMRTRSGTEMYVHDLARSLLRQGHLPVVYSPTLGPLADELARLSVPVVDSVERLSEPPDIIHGHHTLETLAALLAFPEVPGIFVCHDCDAWHDTPPSIPRVRRYIAVDEPCADRLALSHGIDRRRIRMLTNPVDLDRFQRRSPLPSQPRRAITFSNYATPQVLRPIQQACRGLGIELDVIGATMKTLCDQPQDLLPRYDLVFAKGRCAREAMAVGCAVVYCDAFGMGQLVTRDTVERLNTMGRRVMLRPLTADSLTDEIRRYDPRDAEQVSEYIRTTNNFDTIHDQLLEVYEEVLDEHRLAGPGDRTEEARAVAQLVQWWSATREQLVRERARRYSPWATVKRLWQSATDRVVRRRFRRRADPPRDKRAA